MSFSPVPSPTVGVSSSSFSVVGSSPNGDAASVSAGVITLQPASINYPGLVVSGSQTFPGGTKTFSGDVQVTPGSLFVTGSAYVSGNLTLFKGGLLNVDGIYPHDNLAMIIYGEAHDSSSAVAVKFVNGYTALTSAGAKIASFYNDAGTTEKAYVDKDGGGNFFGGLTVTGTLDIKAYDTASYRFKLGTLLGQAYALNNSFLVDNAYYDGVSWTRLTAGYASGFQFYNGQTMFQGVGNGAAGHFTQLINLKSDYNGNFGVGPNISTTLGDFTGALFKVTSGGDAQLSAGSLYVTGSAIISGGSLVIGKSAATAGTVIDITASYASTLGFNIQNASAGVNAQIQNRLVNDAGAYAYYGITSAEFNAYAPINGGVANFGGYLTDVSIFTQSAKDIIFWTNGTEKMRIKSGGDINTMSGSIFVTGSVYISSSFHPATAGVAPTNSADKTVGRSTFTAGSVSATVTNAFCTTGSHVFVQKETLSDVEIGRVVPEVGQFTVYSSGSLIAGSNFIFSWFVCTE